MLYQGKHIFINGESFKVGREDKLILNKLANQRQLNAEDMAETSDDVLEAFCIWYEDGWLNLIKKWRVYYKFTSQNHRKGTAFWSTNNEQ